MKKLDDKGNVAIILCLLITALIGFSAYVVDIGLVYAEKTKLSNSIDAAALAAVLELPNNETKAKNVAEDYLGKNGVNLTDTVINISSDHKSIEIEGNKNVKHFLAQVIGINNSNVNSKTKAIVGPIKSVNGGIRPLAVEKFDFSYGSKVTLKQGAGSGYHGNYNPLALGGQGSSVFKANSLYGYSGKISVGDYIKTETGNMAGASNAIKNYINSENSTFDNFQRDTIRLWIIPLVNTLQVNGRGEVQIVGFGEFYVETVEQRSGQMEIDGRFIRYVSNGEIDVNLEDSGAYGAKLSK